MYTSPTLCIGYVAVEDLEPINLHKQTYSCSVLVHRQDKTSQIKAGCFIPLLKKSKTTISLKKLTGAMLFIKKKMR
jgi:hypothetical protein